MTRPEPILRVEGLRAGYGLLEILQGVDLDVSRGQLVTVLGANGAGKTTLLRAISGLARVRGGSIKLLGRDVTGLRPPAIVGAGVVHVAEGRQLFRQQTVRDNIDLGLYGQKLGGDEEEARVAKALDYFPELRPKWNHRAEVLSGGQLQMLAIAQAIVRDPTVLMLDEPSIGLAPKIVSQVFEIARRFASEGIAVLLVEQRAKEALAIADYAYVLRHGGVDAQGPAASLSAEIVGSSYLGGRAQPHVRRRAARPRTDGDTTSTNSTAN